MEFQDRTKEQLVNQLEKLHRRVSELEESEARLKDTERLLRESEERYRSLVEHIDLGISLIDLDHNVIMTNTTIGKWYFKPASELRGKKCYQVFRGVQSVCPNCHGVQAMTTGVAAESESDGLRGDGTRANVRVQCFPILGPDEKATGFIEVVEDITERKTAEDQLRESERKYRDLFEGAPVGIFQSTFDGRVLSVNPAYARMFGYASAKEVALEIDNVAERIYVEPERRKMLVDLALSADGFIRAENQYRKKDGSLFWGQLYFRVVRDRDGEAKHLEGFVEDITQRKQAQEELRESEERYRAVFDNAAIGIDLVDRDGRYMQVNNALISMLGYTDGEFHQLRFTDITHPDDIEISKQWLGKVMRREISAYRLEKRFIKKDGSAMWGDLSVSAIRNENGEHIATLGVIADITDRKRTEDALREANEIFYTLADQLPAVVFIKDHNGYAQYVNKHMRDIFDSGDWIGRSVHEYFPPDVAKAVLEDDKRALSDGPIMREEWIPDKRGEKRLLETRKFPIFREGKPPLLGGVSIDITERKLTDDKLRASLREKEILLREIHHRVKNNLQLISSLLNLQLRQVKLKDETFVEMFQDIQGRIMAMALVHEALYGSENLESIDVSRYVQSIVVGLQDSSSRSVGELSIKTDVENISLSVNEALACGLIVNELVTNSLKHAFPEGRKGEIVVSLNAVGEEDFQLTVRDNGTGMPEHIDLQRTESLGLDLVVSLAKQLDGTVEFTTGNGTEFQVRFQRSNKHSHGEPSSSSIEVF